MGVNVMNLKVGDMIEFITFPVSYTIKDLNYQLVRVKKMCNLFTRNSGGISKYWGFPSKWHSVKFAVVLALPNEFGFWKLQMPWPVIVNTPDGDKEISEIGLSTESMEIYTRKIN